jgi:hypothetical protein
MEIISLDSALRYCQYALRNVPIEFKHRGRLWRVDTAREAIALRRELEADDNAAFEAGVELEEFEEQVWTPDLVVDLLRGVGEKQKNFLRFLFEKGRVSSTEVRKQLGIQNEISLAGVLSGLSKQLKKLSLKPWDIYAVQIEWDGKGKTRSFLLSQSFKWAAMQLGWPDEWI